MTAAVSLTNLSKDHAGERALRGISLDVPDPCLYGIIGADGAGKSTLMNILATLTDPDAGSVMMLGRDLARDFRSLRSDIGYMPQRFSLYQDLSVHENLDFFADIFGIGGRAKRDRMRELLDFAGLAPFHGRRAGQLSGGMKQKLALACTLVHRPRLLLLDEPTVGVDPVARRDFWIMLKSLRAEGVTLIVSTPYMDEAALCDAVLLLHEGSILAQGSPAGLLRDYPYRLYRVDADPASRLPTLTYPGDRPPPPGFALIYPSGGSLHAAEAIGQPGDPLSRIRQCVPQAGSAEPIQPTLEDCFFALLSGYKQAQPAGSAGNVARAANATEAGNAP
jgi:ABC-2 type transport system ATP-binding protein